MDKIKTFTYEQIIPIYHNEYKQDMIDSIKTEVLINIKDILFSNKHFIIKGETIVSDVFENNPTNVGKTDLIGNKILCKLHVEELTGTTKEVFRSLFLAKDCFNLQLQENIMNKIKKEFIKNRWRLRYINRLISNGYEKKYAIQTYNAIDKIDYEIIPESAADDEVSYWE